MRAWNLTLEDTVGNRIPPGLPMLASARPDSQPTTLTPVAVVADPVNPGRASLMFDNAPAEGGAYTITLYVQGYAATSFRCDLPNPGAHETHGVPPHPGVDPFPLPRLEPSTSPFPPGAKRAPLGPKEPDQPGFGNVYYTLPPEWFTQPGTSPVARDLDLIRGDAFTFMTEWAPQDVNPTCDFAWLQSIGQNTNFGMRMWFTPLLVYYPADVLERFLADYSVWYTHLLISRYDQPFDAVKAVADRARAHGLYVFYFDMEPSAYAKVAAAVDGLVVGLEANKWPDGTVNACVDAACLAAVGKPVWVHFLSTGGPRNLQQWGIEDYIPWWAQAAAKGVTGLMYETYMTYNPDPAYTPDMGADPNELGDGAGKMGAMAGYARRGLFQANPALKFCHCETWSAPPFYGNTDELFASRRNYELVCCPSDGVMGPVSGYFGGARLPDGGVF